MHLYYNYPIKQYHKTIKRAESSCRDDPPPKPSIGSYVWDGFKSYNTEVTYSCGPYGEFVAANGSRFTEAKSVCRWDTSWSDPGFAECRCEDRNCFDTDVVIECYFL